MNLLIVSNLNPKPGDYTQVDWLGLLPKDWKHTYGKVSLGETIDVIISMSIATISQVYRAVGMYPDAKLFCYNWDCYEWVWTNPRPREYNYNHYGDLLRTATEVWVPSNCTGEKTAKWWGIKNWHRIRSACNFWDYDDVKDEGYILCALRKVPDKYWGRIEKICKEADLPLHMTHRSLSFSEYQKEVAHCRFIVSDLYEMSTGGMSLLEAHHLGKPCLISNSPWHGGVDYFGDKATYFQHDDERDLKRELTEMYQYTCYLRALRAKWVTDNYSQKVMVDAMVERIKHYV